MLAAVLVCFADQRTTVEKWRNKSNIETSHVARRLRGPAGIAPGIVVFAAFHGVKVIANEKDTEAATATAVLRQLPMLVFDTV